MPSSRISRSYALAFSAIISRQCILSAVGKENLRWIGSRNADAVQQFGGGILVAVFFPIAVLEQVSAVRLQQHFLQ